METEVIREFTISMALMDFVPVALFIVSAVYMLRDLYRLMSKGAYALLAAGCCTVSIAGFFKALWKLLYAADICDFEALNLMFFPMQSVGFMLLGISLVALLLFRQTEKQPAHLAVAAAPAVFKGTMLFVGFIVAGTLGMTAGLIGIAAKLKRRAAILLFVGALILMLSMGYLSSRDSASAVMNWVEQIVNALGQLCLLLGLLDLHKNGIKTLTSVRA